MEITVPTHIPDTMIPAMMVNMRGVKLSLTFTVGVGRVKSTYVATGRVCILYVYSRGRHSDARQMPSSEKRRNDGKFLRLSVSIYIAKSADKSIAPLME